MFFKTVKPTSVSELAALTVILFACLDQDNKITPKDSNSSRGLFTRLMSSKRVLARSSRVLKLNMNNQKTENKSTDHEEGDHTQPINLVAARSVAPSTTFTGANAGASSQPLAMRPHIEAPKQGLMTLYFRTPTPRPQGQVMGPVVGTQVSSTQHFTTKQAQEFKNSGISSWTGKIAFLT
ncbi:histone deacetylase complex subunit SAP130-A [Nephila pilipes]|uniref:Histone deacetylase complex subunit SAP130-A n=1 Tax=Nephila pilipes TaxID=299642 RepID=A0A8X6JX57_NEPPI|nr:histone deacetylase complex subunit SAP130-A [Nephila pilipes]